MNFLQTIERKFNKRYYRLLAKKQKSDYIQKNYIAKDKLILFFVPNDFNFISGGILSICTIFDSIKKFEKLHKSDVFASFLPHFKEKFAKYHRFKNDLVIFNFEEIKNLYPTLDTLEIHIPEIFIKDLVNTIGQKSAFNEWLKNCKNIKINILNQNDFYMPDAKYVEDLKQLTASITMTVAHEKYATLDKRNQYNIPLHLFSPWLSPTPYAYSHYSEKENIIVLSPDEIEKKIYPTELTREDIVTKLKTELPLYKLITIRDMKYDTYKSLIGKAKFAITFGEGLDGYFIEPLFSGSISFAVKNPIFFNYQFEDARTVFPSYDALMEGIIDTIKKLDNEKEYDNLNNDLIQRAKSIYSLERLESNIENYYLGNIDFK
ncbi:hypothetical protein RF683_03800 [Flavobacterium sp. 20NA77.7]|uniref:Glycosyltransferase family 1 protein n=1 Tax=Flavobacterium nakdongensis TaxID=3073563 RepID=A0ABY9RBE7_9FLAO|nr:hypothetical protein [Flavobacterium sp. 20NA77.7]WMW78575.1 hypothetical protein RF683_03800 [Flavobacterium sp. 20NA77.7]